MGQPDLAGGLPVARGWNWVGFEVSSNSSHSEIMGKIALKAFVLTGLHFIQVA